MKKNFFILLLLLILLGIVAYNIPLLRKNINENVLKTNETSSSDVTIVDVTSLIIGNETEHEHNYKTMYNAQTHWEECTVCGKKNNETGHSYTSKWSMGSADNCSVSNINKFTCNCGYSYESTVGRKSHPSVKRIYNDGLFIAYDECASCGYHLNQHSCYKSNGTKITCDNLGVCRTCGYNWGSIKTAHEVFWYVR